MTFRSENGFDVADEATEGWRLELPSGDVLSVTITVRENYFLHEGIKGPPRAGHRILDTVTATAVVPDHLYEGAKERFELRGVDTCIRWALSKLVVGAAENGWRVSLLAPGEASRAEATQRAREILALSERFREAWHRWKHAVLNDPLLNEDRPGTSEAYGRIVGGIPMGHGPLDRAAREELGPLWPGWQDRAEYAFAALGRVCAAAGVEFTDTESAADALVAAMTKSREENEARERSDAYLAETDRTEAKLQQEREAALIDAAFADRSPERTEPLRAALVHALPYCYEVADQTVMCPECDAVWWGVAEHINENWHAPGCKLFAARVLVHQAVDVRRPREEEDRSTPSDARPDLRDPPEVLRDVVLTGWFSRIAALGYTDVPKDVDNMVWMRAIHAVLDRLPRPATGPYAAAADAPAAAAATGMGVEGITSYTFTAANTDARYTGSFERGRSGAEAIAGAVARCAGEPGRVEVILSATHDRDTRTGTTLRALHFGVSRDGSWRIDVGAGLDGPGSHQLARADASCPLVCAEVALRVARYGASIFAATIAGPAPAAASSAPADPGITCPRDAEGRPIGLLAAEPAPPGAAGDAGGGS